MFLRETVLKKAGVEYRYWRLVKTYWDKKLRKVRHKTISQLGKLKPQEISMFKKTFSGKVGKCFSWEELTARKSFEYQTVSLIILLGFVILKFHLKMLIGQIKRKQLEKIDKFGISNKIIQ